MGQQGNLAPEAGLVATGCCSHQHICGEQGSLLSDEKEAAVHLVPVALAATSIVRLPVDHRPSRFHSGSKQPLDTLSLASRHTLLRV